MGGKITQRLWAAHGSTRVLRTTTPARPVRRSTALPIYSSTHILLILLYDSTPLPHYSTALLWTCGTITFALALALAPALVLARALTLHDDPPDTPSSRAALDVDETLGAIVGALGLPDTERDALRVVLAAGRDTILAAFTVSKIVPLHYVTLLQHYCTLLIILLLLSILLLLHF